MPAVNYRISSRQRRTRAMERSKPPVRRRADVRREEKKRAWKSWFAWIVLFPAAVVSLFTLVELLFRATKLAHFWRTDEFIFFVVGSLAWAAASWFGWRPVKSYVLAHELTHLLVARAFGGRIFDWQVTEEGGYVETNKSNTWITLGPYLVPFYTVLVLLGFGVAGLFTDITAWRSLDLGGWVLSYRWIWLLYWLVGFTWSFHLTFTIQTVHREQGDLTRNGEFFSIMLIFLINLVIIAGLFVAASPNVGLSDVGHTWLAVANGCWRFMASLFA